MLTHLNDLVKGGWRYATGLRGFLNETIDIEGAKAIQLRQLQNREETFLQVVERGIYGNPRSPYKRLLEHAGYAFEDVRTMVRSHGIEVTLSNLYDSGVYVTLDEFKGRAPVRRPGLEFPVTAFDFDNPLLTAHYHGTTGGSRSGGTRVDIDFDQLAHEAAGQFFTRHANHLENLPTVISMLGPPSSAGLRGLFMHARMGDMPIKWFSPGKPSWNRQGIQARLMMVYTLLVARLVGRPMPAPKYTPHTADVARFLAEAVQQGRPALVVSIPSDWVRICLSAEELGLDLTGTVFRGGGEPYTEGKAAVLRRLGARALLGYAMQEAGTVAAPCGDPLVADDLHLMKEKLAILQRPLNLDQNLEVQAFFLTGLLTSASKLMLNAETGDYGVMEERDCGCLWSEVGFMTHVHTIRSYEKLTSGSATFLGSMLHEVLEDRLPSRFGGSPLDYQLVEDEEDGVPRVSVVVSPRVGPVDENAVIEAVLEGLSFADWSRRQADLWRQNHTLRVRRREPYATRAGKILPLHVLREGLGQDA